MIKRKQKTEIKQKKKGILHALVITIWFIIVAILKVLLGLSILLANLFNLLSCWFMGKYQPEPLKVNEFI